MKVAMPIYHSWDTAIKASACHDASACAVMEPVGEPPVHRLIDMWCERVEYPELKRRVIMLAARDKPEAILIEDKASGQSLIQDLRRETCLPIIAMMPQGDKVTRFARVTPMIEAGQVGLPHYAGWLPAFEQELLSFPNGTYDDQVDALSQYLNWVRQRDWDQLKIRRI